MFLHLSNGIWSFEKWNSQFECVNSLLGEHFFRKFIYFFEFKSWKYFMLKMCFVPLNYDLPTDNINCHSLTWCHSAGGNCYSVPRTIYALIRQRPLSCLSVAYNIPQQVISCSGIPKLNNIDRKWILIGRDCLRWIWFNDHKFEWVDKVFNS